MKILLATDGSPTAEVALEMLLALRLRETDQVTVLAIPVHSYVGVGFDGTGVYFAEVADRESVEARRVAETARERIAAKGVRATARADEGIAPHTILDVAATIDADLIVMGSRGLGRIAGAFLGSTARAVAARSPVPVLVVRERREAPRRILVAVDGSEDSLFALRTALDLPLVEGTEITLLHVTPERELRDVPAGALGDELRAAVERRERAEGLEVLSQARALVPAGVAVRMDLERGRAADRIREVAAAAGSDLIVLGSRGAAVRGDRPMQGTTAERLLETAHCAVLVARAPARQKAKVPKREEAAVGAR